MLPLYISYFVTYHRLNKINPGCRTCRELSNEQKKYICMYLDKTVILKTRLILLFNL